MKKQGKKTAAKKLIKDSEKNLIKLKEMHDNKINNWDKLKKAISGK